MDCFMPKLRILFKIDVFVDIQTRLLHLFNNLEDTFLQSTLQIECSDILQSVPLSSVIVHISNLNQTHLKQLIKVFRMQLGSFFSQGFSESEWALLPGMFTHTRNLFSWQKLHSATEWQWQNKKHKQ